ncbi:MAG: hypothetical protein WC211_12020 [Dehalococcoidia bacterium]
MRILMTALAAAALLLAACDEPARNPTPTVTPTPSATAAAATPTRPAEVTPTASAPSTTATPAPTSRPPAATSVPGASPTLPPDGSVSSPPLPPQPVPTATPTLREPSATPPPLEAGRQRELAPIEALSVRIAESSPPQLFVDVTTGLPGGCARFDSAVATRTDAVITLTMWNSMPTGPVACTAIYGYMRHTIALGAFEPGTYTLRVNDQSRTVVVQ